MAKKVTRPESRTAKTPGVLPEAITPPKTGARSKLVLAVVAAAFFGIAAAFFWRWSVARAELQLPVAPNLAGKPAELKERLANVQTCATADAHSPENIAELARLYHVNGFSAEAETCWKILQTLQPREARWCYYLADLRQIVSDDKSLKEFLDQTVQRAPEYSPAWLKLAELEFKSGRLDDAERAYQKRLGLIPGDPYAELGLARIALQRGHAADGRRRIETLVEKAPDFPSAHNLYAEILDQAGEAKAAANQRKLGSLAGRFSAFEDPWIEELRDWCYDPTQLLVWGASDMQTNHRDRAEAIFKRVMRIAPQDPRGYQFLGGLYQERGELAKAHDLYEQGSKLPGAAEPLFVRLSDTCLSLNQPAEALSAVDAGLILYPGSADLLNARGLALDAANRFEEAVEAYRAASVSRPSAANPLANMGISLLRLGRKDEAYACLKRALVVQPMFPKAILVLTGLEVDAGNLEAAYGYIHPFFEQYPEANAARVLMAAWYMKSALRAAQTGDVAAAERACRDGLAANADSADLHGFLGTLLREQGRLPEALENLETAHRLQPADLRVSLLLVDLYLKLGRVGDARQIATIGGRLAAQRGDAAAASRYADVLKRLGE